MSLSFPVSPGIGQVYQQWTWNGTAWVPVAAVGPAAANITLEVALNANDTGHTAGVWNTCRYDTKITDVQNAYNPATGLFTPTVAGLYSVTATIGYTQQAGGSFGAAIVKNGLVANPEGQSFRGVSAATVGTVEPLTCSGLIYCNGTTDTISVQGWLPTGVGQFLPSATMGVAINMVATLLQTGPPGPPGLPGGSGTKLLLQQQTITVPTASIVFAPAGMAYGGLGNTAFDEFQFDMIDWALDATANIPQMQVSPDGGTTWDTGANYATIYAAASASTVISGGGNAAQWTLFVGTYANVAQTNLALTTKMQFWRPWQTSVMKTMHFKTGGVQSAPGGYAVDGIGYYPLAGTTAPAFNAFRLNTSGAANYIRGTFKLWGVQN